MNNRSFNKKTGFLLAAAVAGVMNVPSVMAQGRFLEEVIVTATKRTESASDIPMSISALSADNMSQAGVMDTTDIAALVPGLAFSDSASGTPIYTLRGVGFNEASSQASATVGVYVDELAVPFPIMTRGPMLDIDRVEVLKGPQGTLYGRNSTGGAINYITSRPTEEFEAGVTASYGSYDVAQVEGFVSGALSDKVRARFASKQVKSSEGWQESVSSDRELGEQDKQAYRLSVTINAGEDTDIMTSLNHWSDQSDSVVPQHIRANYANTSRTDVTGALAPNLPAAGSIGEDATEAEWTPGTKPAYDMEGTNFGLTIEHALNDELVFTALTSVSSFDDNGSVFDRSGMIGVHQSQIPTDFVTGSLVGSSGWHAVDQSTVNTEIDTYSQELRLTFEGENVSWVTGLYISGTEVDNVVTQSFALSTSTNQLTGPSGSSPAAPIGNFPEIDNKGYQETTTTALFGSADWYISEELTITTGLRYTEDEADFEGCTADTGDGSLAGFFQFLSGTVLGGPGDAVTGGCVTFDMDDPSATAVVGPSRLIKRELDEDSTSWRLAFDYDLSDDASLYGSYSRGFKSGSFPTLGASSSNQFQPVVQEQVDAYEVGFKTTLDDGAARINGAVFYYDYKDKQLLTKIADPVFGRLFALKNADESTVVGVEFDFEWMVIEDLTLTGAVSYLDTEIGDFVGTNQLGQEINFDGSEFPFSPNVQANFTAKYEWDVSDSLVGLVSVDANYTGSSQADYDSDDTLDTSGNPYSYDDTFDIDSYTIMNARVGLASADEVWNGYVWVRNLTDEFYTTNTLQSSDMMVRYAGMPRTMGITFEYNW